MSVCLCAVYMSVFVSMSVCDAIVCLCLCLSVSTLVAWAYAVPHLIDELVRVLPHLGQYALRRQLSRPARRLRRHGQRPHQRVRVDLAQRGQKVLYALSNLFVR